jgi:polysaccharide pyruvyl transferase WcaK-like protein
LANEVYKRFFDKKIVILSLQDNIDSDICGNISEKLKNKVLTNIEVLKNLSVNDVIDVISDMEYLIAMRFHANVIGIKSGVKTLAVNYDPKVEKLAKEYNLPMINPGDEDISKPFDRLCLPLN